MNKLPMKIVKKPTIFKYAVAIMILISFGGCNRNGCDHNTFLDLCQELILLIKGYSPSTAVEINTWGAPFAGWGSDMRCIPDWDGS